MKKGTVFALALLIAGGAAFADDAKVLPALVGRFYLAPTFAAIPHVYGPGGGWDTGTNGAMFNLGLALEVGVIDWVTAAVQWAPGWTPWSMARASGMDVNELSNATINGVADIFAGAKVQIVGEKAPVANERFRVAVAPGVKIPLPGPDFKESEKAFAKGDPGAVLNLDTHVLGAGARVYVDYVVSDKLFVNFFSEFIYYPMKGKAKDASYTAYKTYGGMAAMNADTQPGGMLNGMGITNPLFSYKDEAEHGYDLTFEIEGVYTSSLADGVSYTAGFPVNFKMTPGTKYTASLTATGAASESTIVGTSPTGAAAYKAYHNLKDNANTYAISVKPNVSVFFTKTPLPLEFKLQYGLPLWGIRSTAMHTVTLQFKAYFALPGAAL